MKERLNKILKAKGITQLELAYRLGITPQSLNSRLKNPTLSSISEMAQIIGCEICELVSDSKKMQLIINDELHTFYNIDELKDFLNDRKE